MRWHRQSILVSTICHPITSLLRFGMAYFIFLIIITVLSRFIPFFAVFIYTKIGTTIHIVLSIVVGMLWARKIVEDKEMYGYNDYKPSPELKEQWRRENQRMFNEHMMYKEMERRAKEEKAVRQRQQYYDNLAQSAYWKSRDAHYRGDSASENYYHDEYRKWKNM